MTEPLPLLIDSSIEIAWDYLNRTGELGDAMVAGRFLSDTRELMVRRGERRCSRRLDGGSWFVSEPSSNKAKNG